MSQVNSYETKSFTTTWPTKQESRRQADDGKWANSLLPPITIPLNIKPSAANHGLGHLNPVNETKYYLNQNTNKQKN